MMKLFKTLFIFSLSFATSFVHAQKSKEIKNTIVKFNLLTPINIFSFPTIQLAVEQKIKGKNSLQTEMGIMPYSFYEKTDTQFVKPSGYKLNVEFRHYYTRKNMRWHKSTYVKKPMSKFYYGANIFYEQTKFNENISYIDSAYSYSYKEDDYIVKKNRFGLLGIFGLQIIKKNNLVFDFYVGIGPMYRNVKNLNREYNPLIHIIPKAKDGPIIPIQVYNLTENTGWTAIVKGGIRFGIRL